MKPCLELDQRVTFTTHPCLTPRSGGSRQNFWMKLTLQKLEGWCYCTVKIARS